MSLLSMKPRSFGVACAAVLGLALCADVPKGPAVPLANPLAPAAKAPLKPNRATQLDINTASREALLKLGLDAKNADKIIAGRPYLTKTKLITNKVISQGVFIGIRDRIKVEIKDPAKAIAAEKAAHPKAR